MNGCEWSWERAGIVHKTLDPIVMNTTDAQPVAPVAAPAVAAPDVTAAAAVVAAPGQLELEQRPQDRKSAHPSADGSKVRSGGNLFACNGRG